MLFQLFPYFVILFYFFTFHFYVSLAGHVDVYGAHIVLTIATFVAYQIDVCEKKHKKKATPTLHEIQRKKEITSKHKNTVASD